MIQQSGNDDTIHLAASEQLYPLCSPTGGEGSSGELQKSLVIMGSEGRPRIGCESVQEGQWVIKFTPDSGATYLKLREVTVSNGPILVGNGTLDFENVHFEKATVGTADRTCDEFSLAATNTKWGNEDMCDETGACGENNIICGTINISLTRCHFKASPLIIRGYSKVQVTVQSSLFDGMDNTLKAISLTVRTGGQLHMVNSSFVHFNYPSLTQYLLNIYEAAVLVNSGRWSNGSMEFVAENCNFKHNERALTLTGRFNRAEIRECLFLSNEAMHSAAAILGLTDKDTDILITGSNFRGNIGGHIKKHFRIREPKEEVQIYDMSVTLNTAKAKGSIEPIGRGGAIRLQRGHMRIEDSRFHDNTANIQGGSIMSDMKTKLIIRNVQIYGPMKGTQPLLGDLVYSRGSTELYDVQLVSRQGKRGMSVLEHVGEHWSLKINSIRVDCPMGHGLRMQEVSAFGVTGNGLRSSTDLFDELSYNCDPCPYGRYSLDNGFVNNTLVPDADTFISLTLGSGEALLPNYTGSYIYHGLQCLPCPTQKADKEEGLADNTNLTGTTVDEQIDYLQDYIFNQCHIVPSASATQQSMFWLILVVSSTVNLVVY